MGPVAYASLYVTGLAWLLTRGQGSHLSLMGHVQAVGWLACKIAHLTLGPQYRAALPLYEFAMLLLVAGLIIAETGRLDLRAATLWKPALFCLMLAQACLWIIYPRDAPLAERWPHLAALNVLGFAQPVVLIAAASVRQRFMA